MKKMCSCYPNNLKFYNIQLVFFSLKPLVLFNIWINGSYDHLNFIKERHLLIELWKKFSCSSCSDLINKISKSISLWDTIQIIQSTWKTAVSITICNYFKARGFSMQNSNTEKEISVEEDERSELFIWYVSIDDDLQMPFEKSDWV